MNIIDQAIERGFVEGVEFITVGGNLKCHMKTSTLITRRVDGKLLVKPMSSMGCIYKKKMVDGKAVEEWATVIH